MEAATAAAKATEPPFRTGKDCLLFFVALKMLKNEH
jgi:hypothetical protein